MSLNGGYQLDIMDGSDEVGKDQKIFLNLIEAYKDEEKQRSIKSSFNFKSVCRISVLKSSSVILIFQVSVQVFSVYQ